jgi:hypothetical protein
VLSIALYVLGPLVILWAVVEAVWTALWVDGGVAPLTGSLASLLRSGWRGVVGEKRHEALTLTGPLILVVTATTWILLVWVGWVLMFGADPHSLVDTRDASAPDWSGRIWYVAYTMFTVGNGDFSPEGAGWQVASGVMAMTGLAVATFAITYLLNVLSAVTTRRSFAGNVTGIGTSPESFVCNAWDGQSFGALDVQLDSIVVQLGTLTHQHLAYPVLHFYHAADSKYSGSVAVAILQDALLLLSHGVAPAARPDPGVLHAAREGVESYLETLAGASIDAADDLPPPPRLDALREHGIPVVDDSVFEAAVDEQRRQRALLLGVTQADAWHWPPIDGE